MICFDLLGFVYRQICTKCYQSCVAQNKKHAFAGWESSNSGGELGIYNQEAVLEHPMPKSVLGSEYIKPTNLQWLHFYTVRPILMASTEKLNFEQILYVTAKPFLALPVLPSILPSVS